jgi:hypothetical protein
MRGFAAIAAVFFLTQACSADDSAVLKTLAKYRGYVIYDVCEIDRVSTGTYSRLPDSTILSTPQHTVAVELESPGEIKAGDTMILLVKHDLYADGDQPLIIDVVVNGKKWSGANLNFNRKSR